MTKWIMFCKRTNDPKLAWIENELDEKGIAHRRNGESFHAPILEVDADLENEAWDILTTPIDNMPDDDPIFIV